MSQSASSNPPPYDHTPDVVRRATTEELQAALAANARGFTPIPTVRADDHHAIKVARDGAQYTRPQVGHSIVKHMVLGIFVLWIPAMYYTASPRHFWHL